MFHRLLFPSSFLPAFNLLASMMHWLYESIWGVTCMEVGSSIKSHPCHANKLAEASSCSKPKTQATSFLLFLNQTVWMKKEPSNKDCAVTQRKLRMIKGANNCYIKPSAWGCHCLALPGPVPQVAKRSEGHNPSSPSPAWPHQPSSALPPQPRHLSGTLLEKSLFLR